MSTRSAARQPAPSRRKKAQQNAASKEIPKIKKAGGDASEVLARMKTLSEEIKEADAALSELNEKQQTLMASLPNLPDEDVQPGGKEQNIPDHVWGEKPQFDFEPKDHVTLCESLGMIDYPRGAKLGGNGAWVYRGWGARMEWALLNFFINEHLNDGYELNAALDCAAAYVKLRVRFMWPGSSRNSPMRCIGFRTRRALTASFCCRRRRRRS